MDTKTHEKTDILLVDDLPDNLRFLSTFLVSNGYSVRKATSGRMAQMAIAALLPDLILLDINLGDINGYELCQQLKSNPATQTIPIIFLSAINDVGQKFKAFQMGGADYITKPFQLEEVLARVQTQLTIRELQQDLEHQNLQLQFALDSLKRAQESLIQQEKMATLKKVVAGVFHEVNNPLSFILGNIEPAHQYFAQLTAILTTYQHYYPADIPELAALKKQADLDFVLEDSKKLLSSMKYGAERIGRVIQALKNFTHLDEVMVKAIDVNDDIESTLILLEHRLQLSEEIQITVHKNYGDVPVINGYPDQVAQVWFNMLSNAIDAIAEKWQKRAIAQQQGQGQAFTDPTLTITTTCVPQTDSPDTVVIRIHDNGIGINKLDQLRIFEPFFTTKPAGQGLGLGLVTSRRIVEELHNGKLTFHSTPEAGTEFSIHLPTLPAC